MEGVGIRVQESVRRNPQVMKDLAPKADWIPPSVTLKEKQSKAEP